jgi:hypothetical protein
VRVEKSASNSTSLKILLRSQNDGQGRGKKGTIHRVLVGIPQGIGLLGRPRRGWHRDI